MRIAMPANVGPARLDGDRFIVAVRVGGVALESTVFVVGQADRYGNRWTRPALEKLVADVNEGRIKL